MDYGESLARLKKPVQIITLLSLFLGGTALASSERAIQMIKDEDWNGARAEVVQASDPALNKFYEWSLYRGDLVGLPFERIATFIQQNPHWPEQNKMRGTAERNMPDTLPASYLVSWFTAYPPVTGEGILKMMAAGESTGQSMDSVLNTAWQEAAMDKETQDKIINVYGRRITVNAFHARFDRLLDEDAYTMARAMAGQLQNGYPKMIEARIALREGKRGADDLMYNVPQNLKSVSGFVFDCVRWLRKNDNNSAAADLLTKAGIVTNITYPEDWWKERNIIARRLMEDKNYSKAYKIAAGHGLSKGSEFAEAEWLSGWLALRFLNRADIAASHFSRMYAKVETAISKARAAYWMGRATDALNKPDEAKTWYYQAGTYPHTYYGQIALNHLRVPISPRSPVIASAADTNSIASSDLIQTAIILHRAGEESLSAKFINAKLEDIKSEGEFQALATYLKRIGNTSGAYRVAKRASWKNIFLGDVAYPSLMQWVGNLDIDPALAHGIIRQESQFDTTARSPAGALGLMQLMPATAREVADKRDWDHQTAWLTSRPEHNILLGSAYLNDLLKRFNGSYPLAIASYNAGPSRVRGWLEAFGDPRAGEINWIDWIELIPVAETRNYVQRVTEGVVTYRDHLGLVKK